MKSYDLAQLSSRAAIAIDGYIKGDKEQKYSDSVNGLAEEVKDFSGRRHITDTLDEEFSIFTRVFWQDYRERKSPEDIYLKAEELADNLRNYQNLAREEQENLRNLCLTVSEMAQSQIPIYPHPYKRDLTHA